MQYSCYITTAYVRGSYFPHCLTTVEYAEGGSVSPIPWRRSIFLSTAQVGSGCGRIVKRFVCFLMVPLEQDSNPNEAEEQEESRYHTDHNIDPDSGSTGGMNWYVFLWDCVGRINDNQSCVAGQVGNTQFAGWLTPQWLTRSPCLT